MMDARWTLGLSLCYFPN